MAETIVGNITKAGPDYMIGEVVTYHYGTMRLTILSQGNVTEKPVRQQGTGEDVLMFYPRAVFSPIPYNGWIYEVQPNGSNSYRHGN